VLIVAMADPSNLTAIDDLKFLTNYQIEVVVASEVQIRESIRKYYLIIDDEAGDIGSILDEIDFDQISVDQGEDDAGFDVSELAEESEQGPIVRLCNMILVDAIKRDASDIHIEPYEKDFRVRYRIDGILYEVMKPPIQLKNAVVSRVKIMAKLDIAERRLPQDGRIKLKLGEGKEMDYRVSCLPTLFGEKLVLRLLDKSNLQLDMTKLGFEPGPLANFKRMIHMPYGMCLVTGPTGSGKTTTLYSALAELNQVSENISTAEDPVEFNLSGINQSQMQDSIGFNFAAALRSFLRQDPDIIMVGEIRDFETAGSPSKRRSRVTWCSRPFTRTTHHRRSPVCSTWASSRSCSPLRSTSSSPSVSDVRSARTARWPSRSNRGSFANCRYPRNSSRAPRFMKAPGVTGATKPGSRAVSRSTKSW
jgi:type IV pilus assembly protein PilB